ncbi:acetoacetate decarboxylase family protein [Streptomyces albus]|uniref:acetoacetate decarboxylase family protein n=1 Tax=Streptomyces albus TaxID=1888 RepID=UPI0006E36B76|nr:acetoacetate decarboxylase family protein [Streptomyces albus]
MSETFPPQPWRLRGQMYVALWQVPARRLPGWRLPPGVRPLGWRERRVVLTFWVDYRHGGTLAYRELLVAMAVRDGHGPAGCAVEAWVDDDRSLAGGRELWGIPKQPAVFAFTTGRHRGRTRRPRLFTGLASPVSPGGAPDGHAGPWPPVPPVPSAPGVPPVPPVPPAPGVPDAGPAEETGRRAAASSSGRVGVVQRDVLRFPVRLRLGSHLVQPYRDGVCAVPMRLSGTVCLARARLAAAPDGPLGYLAGRRPLAAVTLHDFSATVGTADGGGPPS